MKDWIVTVVALLGVVGTAAAEPPEVLKDARVAVKEASGVALMESPDRPFSVHARLTLEVRGEGMKGAIGIGPLELKEATDDAGEKLTAKAMRWDMRPASKDGIVALNPIATLTEKEQGYPKRDSSRPMIHVTLNNMPGTVASLKGSVKTFWPAKTEAVPVEKLEEKAGKAIEDKRLEAAGVKVVLEKVNADGMMLELSGKVWAITGVRIKSRKKIVPMAMFERSGGEGAFIGVMGEMPANATLELDVVTEVKEKVIPVELKNIEVELKPRQGKKVQQTA